jgi:cytochrome P450
MWAIPRHHEVVALLRDARLGPFRLRTVHERYQQHASLMSPSGAARTLLDGILVAAAGADHIRVRRVLARAVGSRVTPALKARVESHATALLLSARERGDVDGVTALAFPLPVLVIADLFGLGADESDAVARRVLTLSKMFSLVVSPGDRASADEAVHWLRDAIGRLVDERQQDARDDVISDLAAAVGAGVLSRVEAVDNLIFAIFAGLETSISLIASGCAALARFPDQFATLRGNPACAPRAVDEFLRYEAPTQITARVVEAPIEMAGQTLRPGRIVLLLLASANHDERAFTDPARLDLERAHNPHVSFGGGAHYCLGAALAHLEGVVVFSRLAATFATVEPVGPVVRERCATPSIFSSVPMRVT